MTTASLVDFLHSNFPQISWDDAAYGGTQPWPVFDKNTMNLDTWIAQNGGNIQALLDQRFGKGVKNLGQGDVPSYNPTTGQVDYKSDAENGSGGLSGFMESELAPVALFGLGAGALSGMGFNPINTEGLGSIASGDMSLWNVTGNELGAGPLGTSTTSFTGSAPNIANMPVGPGATPDPSFTLSPEATNLVPQTGTNLTGGAATAAAPVTDLSSIFNPATAGGLPNAGNAIAAATGSGGLADFLTGSGSGGGLLQQLLGGQGQGQGAYSIPWGNVLGALLEYMNQGDVLGTQKDLLKQAIDSDLWRTEQPKYFGPLYDAATKGIGDTAYGQSIAEATDRFGASKGYGSSSNMLQEIARGLNQGTTQYINSVAPLAMGRGGQGSTYAQFAPGITGAMQGQSGALGAGLQSIISGSQPTYAQQLGGQPRNKTLSDLIASL